MVDPLGGSTTVVSGWRTTGRCAIAALSLMVLVVCGVNYFH